MTDTSLTTEALRDAAPTPIAQLNPDIIDAQNRVVQGVITIIWPFSIVTKSIAFILAEPDFRLRRDNGQVRLRFHGAVAKAIADAKLGGGDEVRVSLKGVKWEKNEMETQMAGSTLQWQLEFANRLFFSVQRAGEGEEEVRIIDVDVPEADEAVTNGTTNDTGPHEDQSTTEPDTRPPQSPEISLPSKRTAPLDFEAQELASPAFIKRARLSYGSLFEGGFDIFDEPQSKNKKKDKSRRRSRFSLPANAWRYSSRSPSPEVDELDAELEQESDHDQEANSTEEQRDTPDVPMTTPSRPEMVDGGCQTDDVDFTPMRSVQVLAEARPDFAFPYATPTPLPRSRPEDLMQAHPLNFQAGVPTPQVSLAQETANFHTPAHLDPSLGFNFESPQANLFPGPSFVNAQDGNIVAEHGQHLPHAEQYGATFLDNQHQSSTAPHSFHSSHAEMEPREAERPHVHFEPEAQFYPPFEEEELSQPLRTEWQTSQFTAANSLENPLHANNPPTQRDQIAPDDQHSSPARSSSAPNESEQEIGLQEILDKRPEYDREEELDAPQTEEQGFFTDGGDRPGDDYDLRNYDRAHADDDDVIGSSEESAGVDTDDPDAQIINPEEDDEVSDSEAGDEDEEVDGYDEAQYGEYDGEEEGEYYSDEEMYDEEEDSEEEEASRFPPQPAAPKEPVFISLLSDSEDEDEAEPKPEPEPEPEPQRREHTGPTTESESEPQSEEGSESGGETDEETGPEEELTTAPPVELDQAPEIEAPRPSEGPQGPVDDMEKPMESDEDEEIAEDTIPAGQELPSEDRMEVDGDQTPEPPAYAPESKTSQQAGQETHPVDRAENASAPLSIERGVPAEEEYAEPDRGNIDTNVAPVSPHESNGDEQVEDEIQVSEVVQVEEIVTISGDAMEVDTTSVVQPEEHDQAAGIAPSPANDTAAIVRPTGSTPAEDATTDMETHKEAINVEATNVVEVLAEIVVAPTPTKLLPPASNVHDQTTSQAEEDIAEEFPEVQGLDHRSPDATLQETFQPVTAEHRPLEGAQASQSDNGEGHEQINEGEQLATNTPFSPPATQVSQSQISKDFEGALSSQATTSTHLNDGNLPTPHDTQQDAEMSALYPAEEYHGLQGEERETGPEDQIITEFLQESPERLEAIQNANPASVGTSLKQFGVHDEGKPLQKEQGSEVLSTVKSLRSRGHRLTRSSDLTKALYPDPSAALARAPAPPAEDDDEKNSSPTSTLRITRSKADSFDPSIYLARASPNQEEFKALGDSPTGTIRVTRSMADHADPSVHLALARTPTQSTRQTRRQHTPEIPHRETRASSRGFPKSDSPDAVEYVLHSPSVAGSAVEDESANALKLQLLKSLRTSMPEYQSLKLLRNSLNKTVDLLAVATTTPAQAQRPKGGPRDYMLSLNLTDPSTAPTSVVVANLFRPHQASLPVVHAGDIVLLRRVQVVSMKNRGFGVRTGDSSAWAVFEKGDAEMLPQIKGPPVELSDEEAKYAEGLRRWWNALDEKSMDKIDKVSRKIIDAASKEHKEP